ncbi:hypothetical protein LTR59_000865 [Friedmanniomyces endolithicus]|nr:hypothetical protein LTR94_010095 [Friedmanniomyces endolithicus]KAK0806634.1 hypothetical protein LTR38_005118 [Friedmanniomyces endolithicus]KAK0814328.1 hypothetical protein LTR59_000865 [Friedmanniomyces endolithicus]KAK0818609.1 hypothetical protein LTR75_002522 [Friedmanniomyces endolithicus]
MSLPQARTNEIGYSDEVEMADHSASTTRPSKDNGMIREKFTAVADVNTENTLEDQDASLLLSKSTPADAANMRRMGKPQQLIRHFRFLSTVSFVALATAAWEIGLFVLTPGLTDGGRAGLVWNVLWNIIGFGPIYLSMAEMASMAPIAGAQYHWVSEFAPDEYQRILSYISGWTSTIAWQAGNAQGLFLVGSLIQTMILINDDSYGFPSWQGTLLAFMAVLIAYTGVVYGAKVLPYWQNAVFVVHILAYLGYIIPVWVSSPRATHAQVWTEFDNGGGWNSMGLSVLIGQLSGISTQCGGIDTAAHMSEEIKDAAYSVRRVMVAVYIINALIIFPGVVTVVYHIDDLNAALNDPTTYPAIYVLRGAMSVGWITVILVLIALLNVASNIVYLAAVTRDLFAFARDRGLPFSRWISKIDDKRHIPVNACILSSGVACCLALIYIGSPLAFYAITSLGAVSLLQCYTLSIGCILWRRLSHPETLPPAQFSLGRWGVPVNVAAVVYGTWCFFWAFWPQQTPVTAAGLNWAAPIFVAALIGAMLYFVFTARKTYVGPVTEVEGRKEHFR